MGLIGEIKRRTLPTFLTIILHKFGTGRTYEERIMKLDLTTSTSQSYFPRMAEGENLVGGDTAGISAWKKKHQDVETQNLEKVTDYVEEAENSEELGKVSLQQIIFYEVNKHSFYVCVVL